MYPSRFFLYLAAVMILLQRGVAPPVPIPGLDAFINVNTTVLDKFIQKKIDQAFNGDHPFQSTSGADIVKSTCKRMFADQPRKISNTRINFLLILIFLQLLKSFSCMWIVSELLHFIVKRSIH